MCSIIESKIYKFVVGHRKKEYSIHGAVLSGLSKPLKVLLEGPYKEAQELRVEWPDVDEETFVRFIQWAYTKNYDTAEPEVADGSNELKIAEQPLYSLTSVVTSQKHEEEADAYGYRKMKHRRRSYNTCSNCGSTYTRSDCPGSAIVKHLNERGQLIVKFLDETGEAYPTTNTIHIPRKNTEGCKDYSGVFLCHAKLYVLGDMYIIPELCQLSLHRLHVTLKEFTLYPSRLNDISTLAKYVFNNTQPGDKIQDMITLYYACIIEDASKHEGLKSLIEEVPDFAYGLISKMSERLA